MAAAYTEKRSYFESNVCRLCSFARDKVLPIFDTSGSKFDAKIRDCLHRLNITPGDGKPQQICLECITKLNIYHEFFQLCMRSDSYFDAYIKAYKVKEQSEEALHQPPGNSSNSNSENSDGLIVLSKLDQSLPDSLRDLVVVVELKYKDGTQPPEGEAQALPGSSNGPEGEWSAEKAVVQHILNRQADDAIQPQDVQRGFPTSAKPIEHLNPPSLFRYDPAKKEFECAVCDKKFKKRTRLNSHLACHTDYRPHSCDQCGKTFAMKWDLNVHLRLHKREIVCSRCDKAFSTKSKLERHIRVHTGEKPFYCTYCDKNFGDKRNLDNHLRSHTGIKPYACSICDKAFTVQSHMVEHLNVHKKTPSYSCSLCDKTFRWRSNYKKHLKTHGSSENG